MRRLWGKEAPGAADFPQHVPVTPQGGKIKADLAEPPRGSRGGGYSRHAPPGQREQPVALERDGRQERKARQIRNRLQLLRTEAKAVQHPAVLRAMGIVKRAVFPCGTDKLRIAGRQVIGIFQAEQAGTLTHDRPPLTAVQLLPVSPTVQRRSVRIGIYSAFILTYPLGIDNPEGHV